jgi:carbonic anhydrase
VIVESGRGGLKSAAPVERAVTRATLRELLERNARHVDGLAADHFAAVEDGQAPAAVSVCCADSRVSQEGMFAVDRPGWLFTPSTIGNQAWDRVDGDLVVDGSVLFPLVHTGTETAVVVGHTGCGAVTAAVEAVEGEGGASASPGVGKWVDLLVDVVERAHEDPAVEADAVDALVEYNVRRQVEFLHTSAEVPAGTDVYGFVYDLHGSYGGDRGRTVLVAADGETDPESLRSLVPGEFVDRVDSLL